MSETFFTAENEEVRDPTNFSVMALFGFFLVVVGLFSIQYIQIMPVALVGVVLGALALLLSKRFKIGFFSKALAFLAVVIGSTSTSYSFIYRSSENRYELSQACRTAELYLENLSKGDLDHVFFLVGFPSEMPDVNGEAQSPTARAMKRLSDDPTHKEIRERKSPAKWAFVSLEGEYSASDSHTYKLIYKDDGQSIPSFYKVVVRKNCSKYNKIKKKVNWFVDSLESTKMQ